ncbi:lyase family protein [Sphingomonas montana]|uniref:lyase family protein n=1 Tax=Sphingomonas montana TaxID=1843236 RepID=UPI001F0A1802|nr:lyase family protein [Sphingomonas montana]
MATPVMTAAFGDAALVAHALAFEAALGDAQAAEGLIEADVAAAIGQACGSIVIDPAALAEEVALAGTLAIPLVVRLRGVLDGAAAQALHRGATSQDLADVVMMRQVRAGAGLLLADADRIVAALSRHARAQAATPAIGRTLLQDAIPIGFGLRIAQWCAGIADAAAGVRDAVAGHAAVQLGGAAGTRAGHGGRGAAVAARMATALGLADAPPWHARRGGVAAIGAAVAILTGACGKMARDVALLAQAGIGETREPAAAGRGGSSAMAHKRNPTGCQVALSAAARAPGLVAGLLAGLPAEEERGLGGWQAEAPLIADLFLIASGALEAMAAVAEGLEIDPAAIAHNLAAAGQGDDIGESVAIVAALIDRTNLDRG